MRALETCAKIFKPAECANYFEACGYDTTCSEPALIEAFANGPFAPKWNSREGTICAPSLLADIGHPNSNAPFVAPPALVNMHARA
jgi:hypothetical protein